MKITLQNLTKKFPGRGKNASEVIAVNDFTFEIPDGKLIGLLGPSGCGKSTALNLLCGLLEPTSGKIFFGEDDVTDLPAENRGVGMVFQNYALYPHLTVRQNILFPLQNRKGKDKLSKEDMEQKALEAAKLVQIDQLMDRKPSELSGGQQQRCALARILVGNPQIVLLDEPFSALDEYLRDELLEETMSVLSERHIPVFFVTHSRQEARAACTDLAIIHNGTVQETGKAGDIFRHPRTAWGRILTGTEGRKDLDFQSLIK